MSQTQRRRLRTSRALSISAARGAGASDLGSTRATSCRATARPGIGCLSWCRRRVRRASTSGSTRPLSRPTLTICSHGWALRIVLAGAQSNWCIRASAYGALERGYDLTLVKDAHTTSDLDLGNGAVSTPPRSFVIST